jgi:serine/threonine-protein kinase RsbT
VIAIRSEVDVWAARTAARAAALGVGMPASVVHELAIVASELAWNVLKHGGGGHMAFEPVAHAERGPGLRLVAADAGPPIRDLALALRDGFDDQGPIDPASLLRRGGLGAGLGAVARLTDELRYEQAMGSKRIEAVRYLRRPSTRPQPPIRQAG